MGPNLIHFPTTLLLLLIMGNSLGRKRTTVKIMKINGKTFRLRAPVPAGSVLSSHPGHVLLDSEAVRHYGVRAEPLEPQMDLKPRRLYFLVELPQKLSDGRERAAARRASTGIRMSAKDRLESLMLARRSASDLTGMSTAAAFGEADGVVRVRLRLSRAEVEKLLAESKDDAEMKEKIINLCRGDAGATASAAEQWKGDLGLAKQGHRSRKKRVGFLPINEEEIHHADA